MPEASFFIILKELTLPYMLCKAFPLKVLPAVNIQRSAHGLKLGAQWPRVGCLRRQGQGTYNY